MRLTTVCLAKIGHKEIINNDASILKLSMKLA